MGVRTRKFYMFEASKQDLFIGWGLAHDYALTSPVESAWCSSLWGPPQGDLLVSGSSGTAMTS